MAEVEQLDILIIDDNRTFTTQLKAYLLKAVPTLCVRVVPTTRVGLTVAKKVVEGDLTPRVIGLDEYLADDPDGGVRIAEFLAERGSQVPIVGISANGMQIHWPEVAEYIGKNDPEVTARCLLKYVSDP